MFLKKFDQEYVVLFEKFFILNVLSDSRQVANEKCLSSAGLLWNKYSFLTHLSLQMQMALLSQVTSLHNRLLYDEHDSYTLMVFISDKLCHCNKCMH